MPDILDDAGLPQRLPGRAYGRAANFLPMARSGSMRQATKCNGGVNAAADLVMNMTVAREVTKLLQMTDEQVLTENWHAYARRQGLRFRIPKKLSLVQEQELELCRRAHRKHGTGLQVDRTSVQSVHGEAERHLEAQPLLRNEEREFVLASHTRAIIGHLLSQAGREEGMAETGDAFTATRENVAVLVKRNDVLRKAYDLLVAKLGVEDLVQEDTVLDDAERAENTMRALFLGSGIIPFVHYTLPPEDPRESLFQYGSGTVRNTGERTGRNEPCACGSGKKFKKCCGKPQN